MIYPQFHRGKHLPYGTQPGPIGYITGEENAQIVDEGSNSVFCLFMSLEEFCACLYRVKKWKLAGQVVISEDVPGQINTVVSGYKSFELVFSRTRYIQPTLELTEPELFNLSINQSLLFSSEQSLQFQGTKVVTPDPPDNPIETSVYFTLSASIGDIVSSELQANAVGKSLTRENKLAVAFMVNLAVSGVSEDNDTYNFNTVANLGSFDNAGTGQSVSEIKIVGPFAEPGGTDLTVPLYEIANASDPKNKAVFSNMILEPKEWFTYQINNAGPIYDSETGDFL